MLGMFLRQWPHHDPQVRNRVSQLRFEDKECCMLTSENDLKTVLKGKYTHLKVSAVGDELLYPSASLQTQKTILFLGVDVTHTF